MSTNEGKLASRMRFFLLGYFEIQKADGAPLAVSRVKQRQLLALLLLDSPSVVTTERCIRALWGEEVPPSARRNLQTYIAGLRKALAVSEVTIETVPGGYRMAGIGDGLDLTAFETLRSRAALALSVGQDAAGIQVLREALDMWRGSALQDLAESSEVFRNAAIRLDGWRLTAIGDFADGCIRMGAYETAIDQLRAAISWDPLREDLRGRLMLAYHLSGRRADALLAYHECRAALVQRLGVGPSHALALLHNKILMDDPHL
ncbi:AfsR/SARP family transcriptional regulator [Nonomuraea basaltis]|uniref:AfsR/SARP family transcriptional regulator n=1 Tax=Nonomuraea basaltis TaxID=2495887 RepID=UPI00110C486E|nr:AfsR/SARP family transcriptional regulator [Nonomuraea basaltis]TMR93517.1 AfsR/SARP family transcriptional regulator [Nonomuraea basaltis]